MMFILTVFILLFIAVGINWTANRFIFRPVRKEWPLQLPWEQVFFRTQDGTPLHALYLPAKENKETLLFFHGKAGNVTYFEDFAKTYAKYGYGILLFDYRGYGKSKGRLTESHMYQDGAAALGYLLKKKMIPAQKIVVWGYSLGNGPAVQTAADFNILPLKAVILQSPFTNTAHMASYILLRRYRHGNWLQKWVSAVFSPLFFNKKFDNLAKIRRIKAPMLIAYSRQDVVIPWQMSCALADKAPRGTRRYFSPRGEHEQFRWLEKAAVNFLSPGTFPARAGNGKNQKYSARQK